MLTCCLRKWDGYGGEQFPALAEAIDEWDFPRIKVS